MRYCEHCGKQVNDEAIVCIGCGCKIPRPHAEKQYRVIDKADPALIVLCVILPIVGLVLWGLKSQETPNAAKCYGKASLISIAIIVIVGIFLAVGVYYLIEYY